MGLKEMYACLFYELYKFFESMKTTRWFSDAKVVLVILSLELWFLFSLNNYLDVYLKKHGRLLFFFF